MSIHVQLERFEGPLGLLLHLIREQEMDIFNINIHHITRQYLDYIRAMRRLDLEVAGEFVAMAATLLHIKSRMLLPQYNDDGEVVTPEDPRRELVEKLIEYKRFKELSAELARRAWLGRDVFTRGEREVIAPVTAESELILEENPLFSLIASYRAALRNMKKSVHEVSGELQSIAARILEMRPRLIIGQRVLFRDFITASENAGNQVLVTFLSLLELAKMGLISVFQSEPFADIHIETKHEIENNAVSRVENYDAVNADLKAEEIMHDASLSLNEPVAMLEGEDESVVEAGVADAASDDEILAEESRLFGGDAGVVGSAAGDAAASVAEPADLGIFTETHLASEDELREESLAVSEDETMGLKADIDASETELGSDALADMGVVTIAHLEAESQQILGEDSNRAAATKDENSSAPQGLSAGEDSPGTLAAEVKAEFQQVNSVDDVCSGPEANVPVADSGDKPEQHTSAPEVNASAPESPSAAEVNDKNKPPKEEAAREKISSALHAAFSAFDAFENIPTPPPADRPPEVNE